jgi:hypothetical protein
MPRQGGHKGRPYGQNELVLAARLFAAA